MLHTVITYLPWQSGIWNTAEACAAESWAHGEVGSGWKMWGRLKVGWMGRKPYGLINSELCRTCEGAGGGGGAGRTFR